MILQKHLERAREAAAELMASIDTVAVSAMDRDDLNAAVGAYMDALPRLAREEIWVEVAGDISERLTICIGDESSMGQVMADQLIKHLRPELEAAEPDACRLLSEMQRLSHADAELDRRAAG